MTAFAMLFAVTGVWLSGCSTVEIPKFNAYVTLPASGNGFGVSTVGGEEIEIPKAKWEIKRQRAIILLAEDWEKLRYTLLKNCILNECKQTVGALDGLFGAIDDALKLMPKK